MSEIRKVVRAFYRASRVKSSTILKVHMRFVSMMALLCVGAFAQAPAPAVASAFSGVEEAIAQLSKITGFRATKKVQFDTITKAQFKVYLQETIKDQIKPEEVRSQELALKKLGLVPASFDLMTNTVDLLTEQAAAFYDYRRKKLFVMEGGDPASQPVLVVHELAHALADQHFDLGRFIKRGKSDDASLARMAVMEGQATWLMMESTAQKMGMSLKSMPGMAESMSGASGDLTGQYPILNSAPLYIRASLLFPYKDGFKFQHMLIQKLGEAAFAKVFKEAPLSSRHILHPETYLSGEQPADPVVPVLANAQDYKEVVAGSLGEFDHAVLLEQYVNKAEAAALAPKWRGGNIALLEHRRDRNIVMVYASEWHDETAALKMFNAYRSVLKGKWKNLRVDSESKGLISGLGDDGSFRVWVSGNRLFSAEGMKSIADLKDLTIADGPGRLTTVPVASID
jgi:hypothetical protein